MNNRATKAYLLFFLNLILFVVWGILVAASVVFSGLNDAPVTHQNYLQLIALGVGLPILGIAAGYFLTFPERANKTLWLTILIICWLIPFSIILPGVLSLR